VHDCAVWQDPVISRVNACAGVPFQASTYTVCRFGYFYVADINPVLSLHSTCYAVRGIGP